MKQGFSIWLDVLRIVATITVVASHVAYARFTDGNYQWLRDLNLGSDAVILFFLISGIVIARAAERDATLPVYAFNRATRIFSVMIPAVLLTWSFDHIGFSLNPTAYPPHFFQPLPLDTFLVRGLTVSNEWALFGPVRLGTNGPLWSLSYEVAYYALLGAAVFLTGALRLAVLMLMVLVFGLNVLLLMPAWLMGVLIWHLVRTGFPSRLSSGAALALALVPPVIYALLLWSSAPLFLLQLTTAVLPASHPVEALRFSDEFLWNALIGGLFAVHLIAMQRLLDDWQRGASAIRWCAQASFSIYVTHYPALHLLHVLLPHDIWGRALWLFLGALAVGLVFARIFERPLDRWRQLLRPKVRALR